MPFVKGRKKTGGRKSGSLNKVKKDLHSQILGFVITNFPEFVRVLNEIEDEKEKAKLYLKALEFVLPKQKQIEIDGDVTVQALNVEFKSNNKAPLHDENDFLDD